SVLWASRSSRPNVLALVPPGAGSLAVQPLRSPDGRRIRRRAMVAAGAARCPHAQAQTHTLLIEALSSRPATGRDTFVRIDRPPTGLTFYVAHGGAIACRCIASKTSSRD